MFNRDVKALFIENHKVFIRLKSVPDFKNYNSEVKDLYRCMYLHIAKTTAKVIECYLEIMVRLLINGVGDISDDLLMMYHSYKISHTQSRKFRNMFVNHAVLTIKKFFLNIAHV